MPRRKTPGTVPFALADVGLEQILLEELHLVGHTGLDGILARLQSTRAGSMSTPTPPVPN